MALTSGSRLGPYEITGPLGVGGMGEVYRATDTNLKRQVALKVLPESVAGDADRLARFQREAEVLAALNHPNIAQIHGLERSGGATALVMELVEGPTLADRLVEGPVPQGQALAIAMQIAEALEAAHRQGIVHRDLKPANIKLRSDGMVKVLDFGLAKAMEPAGAGAGMSSVSIAPTLTTPAMTQAGLILGTAAYMSPEQAGGTEVDQRSDIWAFGVVLYEMLTGRRLFDGDSVARVLARVLERELDFSALPPATPRAIRTLLRRCLERDRKRRLHHIADARVEIEEALANPGADVVSAAAAPTSRAWPATLAVAAGALLAGAGLAVVAGRAIGGTPEPPPLIRFSVAAGQDAFGNNPAGAPILALSPDGRTLVHGEGLLQQRHLYRRDLAFLEVEQIPGTEGVQANTPFFSPDSRWIGWASGGPGAIHLKRVSLAGGPAATILEATMIRGVSWGPDDMLVYGSEAGMGLKRVAATGGTPEDLTTLAEGEIGHYRPDVLPDGSGVLFTIWRGALDTAEIAVLDMASRAYRPLVGGTFPRYVSSGHVVFARANSLWAIPFDAGRLEATGPAVPVVDGVDVAPTGVAQFAVSRDGTLVYAPAGGPGAAVGRRLVRISPDGTREPLAAPARPYLDPLASPDGTRVAVSVGSAPTDRDIWVWHLANQTLTRLTFDAAADMFPLWTSDGTRIVFWSARDGGGIFSQAADGTGMTERLLAVGGGRIFVPAAWAPDGSLLFMTNGVSDIGLVSFQGPEPEVRMLLASAANETAPSLSPDGRWLAYVSNESNQPEIHVRPFPDVESGKWQVTSSLNSGGSAQPVWSADGRELYFTNQASASLYAVDVKVDRTFAAGTPRAMFNLSGLDFPGGSSRALSALAGGRLLGLAFDTPARAEAPERRDLVTVLNWAAELTRLAPAD
jgi:serine/threonine-protein kinase